MFHIFYGLRCLSDLLHMDVFTGLTCWIWKNVLTSVIVLFALFLLASVLNKTFKVYCMAPYVYSIVDVIIR